MLNLIDVLDKQRFYPRIYIAALTDNMSLSRAATMEESMMSKDSSTCKVGLTAYIAYFNCMLVEEHVYVVYGQAHNVSSSRIY